MDFATLLSYISWEFYNNIFNFLVATGMIYIPIIIIWWQNYISLLNKDANTSISSLSIKGMFMHTAFYVIVLFLAVIPSIEINKVHLVNQNISNYFKQEGNPLMQQSAFNQNVKDKYTKNINIDNTQIPYWWALTTNLSHGVIEGIKSVLPTKEAKQSILSQMIKFEEESVIRNPTTRGDYNAFYQTCYQGAYTKFDTLVKKGIIKKEDIGTLWDTTLIAEEQIDWAGAPYFLDKKTGKGFYVHCDRSDTSKTCYAPHSTTPGGFKMPMLDTTTGKEYEISCEKAWESVRYKLYSDFNFREKGYSRNDIRTPNSEADQLLRLYLQNKEDPNDKPWYEDVANEVAKFGSLDYWQAIFTELLATIGMFIMGLVKTMATYMVKMIIPISIVMTQFLIVVFLPLIAIVGAFRPDMVIFVSMLWFSTAFIEVIINIVGFLHENVLAMYTGFDGVGSNSALIMGAQHALGSNGSHMEIFLIDFMMLMLYTGAIGLWVKLLVFVGNEGMGLSKGLIDDMTGVGDGVINKGMGVGKGLKK
jgi:hypothetical protein